MRSTHHTILCIYNFTSDGPPAPATLPGRAPDFSFQNEEVVLAPELVAELVWLVRSGIAAGPQLDCSWHSAAAGHASYPAVVVFETLRLSSCLTFPLALARNL